MSPSSLAFCSNMEIDKNPEQSLDNACDIEQLIHRAKAQTLSNTERLSGLLAARRALTLLPSDTATNEYSEDIATTFERLISLAYCLCDWSLLISLYQTRSRDYSVELVDIFQHIGRYDLAKQALSASLIAKPTDPILQQVWQHISINSDYSWHYEQGDFWITPLTPQHLYDFAWQYSSSIQALCNLPVFVESDDWHHWLDDMQNDPHREVFAIFHQEWGFIGSVSLQLYEGIGFFYYWLGEDFQGMGLGPQAVELLMQWGEQQGMTCCYAKIYADNIPSHKAIQKIGFQPLPFTAAAPDEHEVFYYRGANKPEHQLFQGLKYLLYAMNSDIQPLPNQQTMAA